MKGMTVKTTDGLQVGSYVNCIDNTGAKQLQIIAVLSYKGIRRRHPKAGVGSVVVAAVKKGSVKMMHEKVKAVIVRQKMPYRRNNGMHVKFEDNAAVILDDKKEPKGKQIKGVIAKEVVERFPTVGKIAQSIM